MRALPIVGPWIVRLLIKRMHAATVVSRRSRDKIKALFSPQRWSTVSTKLRIIPMGVDTRALSQGEPPAFNKCKPKVLLFIGRLSEKKGLDYLLDAFSNIAAQRRDTFLWIAGDGELRAHIEQRVCKLRLTDSVHMLGYVTGEQKLRCIRDAHIMIVPSIITADGDAEGLPVSLLEGMAAGKICVATDASGADDIIVDGQSGFLIKQKDAHGLCAAISVALDLSPMDFQAMSRKAQERAVKFDWESIATRHFEHLFKDFR